MVFQFLKLHVPVPLNFHLSYSYFFILFKSVTHVTVLVLIVHALNCGTQAIIQHIHDMYRLQTIRSLYM